MEFFSDCINLLSNKFYGSTYIGQTILRYWKLVFLSIILALYIIVIYDNMILPNSTVLNGKHCCIRKMKYWQETYNI